MNPYFYRQAQDDPARRRASLPPHFQSFPQHAPGPFNPYAYPPAMPPFGLSYPLQSPPFPTQLPPFMPQHYPPVQRPIPSSLLDDPAFSPDPRSNPLFFSMNDREEIYPASVSDSLSDYASSVADDESEVDHSHLPPRMRLLHDAPPPPPPRHHARSQSTPYTPAATLPSENLTRSNSARVIPVPPPVERTSTPGSHLRKRSPEDLRLIMPGPSPVYASASLAAQQMWQPPPPYSDSETESSSSNPQTPSATPPSASSHLPKGTINATLPPLPEKRASPQSQLPPQPVAASPNTHAAPQPRNQAPTNKPTKTSPVQSTASRPPINSRNASAPELHPPPPPIEVPPRPSTVPIPATPPGPVAAPKAQRRRNSKNPSIAAPPRDLDRIDELDESDPLGFAWHHGGPYEAIAKASSTLHPDSSGVTGKRAQVRSRLSRRKGCLIACFRTLASEAQAGPAVRRCFCRGGTWSDIPVVLPISAAGGCWQRRATTGSGRASSHASSGEFPGDFSSHESSRASGTAARPCSATHA